MAGPPGAPPPSRRVSANRVTNVAKASTPRAASSSARACLELLCRALSQLGVGLGDAPGCAGDDDGDRGAGEGDGALTAETLRRAKFNHESATAPLWRALHDLVIVGIAGYPDPATAAAAIARVRAGGGGGGGSARNVGGVHGASPSAQEDEACAQLARHYLRTEGYPHVDELVNLPARDGPSRPLLVALAWLVRLD